MTNKWQMANGKWKFRGGFTLVELLVVISLIGVLVTIALVSFRSSQARGRDAERKSDLKEIRNALELFYSDYGKYPTSSSGLIQGCPFVPAADTGTSCIWGTSEFGDFPQATIYFKKLPKDRVAGRNYYYRIIDPGVNEKFQLFASLENSEDPNCIVGSLNEPDCANPVLPAGAGVSCGSQKCNFAVTSTNTTPSE